MFNAIRASVMLQVQGAMAAAAEEVSASAKHKAPVRKIFKTGHHRDRAAVVNELGEPELPGSLMRASSQANLSRRGRYEVRTMRAFHEGDVGGRLRDEIYATDAMVEGNRVSVRVISPTPYAKYQEFGTRHNAAHPFLRPALEESRANVVGQISAAIGRGIRAPIGRTNVNVRVHI